MEQWWNDTDMVKLKYSEKNLSQHHFVHQKSHIEWPGIEPGASHWEASDFAWAMAQPPHDV
jgi:hypothetical protein